MLWPEERACFNGVNKAMKIVALMTDAYGDRGGIAQFNRNILSSLNNNDLVESIFLLQRKQPQSGNSVPEKIHLVEHAAGNKIAFVAAFIWRLIVEKPDLIICGHINFVGIVSPIRRWFDIPAWAILHGIEAWESPKKRWLVNSLSDIDKYLIVSSVTKQRFLKWAPVKAERICLFPNSVDLNAYSPGAKPRDLVDRYKLEGKKVIMTLGRLSLSERYKGHDEIIDVLPAILRRDPSVKYLIVGDGDYRQHLEQKVIEMGLGDAVCFAGYVPDEQKQDYYRLADLLAMPGYGEGFGIVYLEALASGTPALGSCLDGSVDALQNGRLGRLVDPRDPEDLIQGLVESLNFPKGNVPDGLKEFSLQRLQDRVNDLIESFSRG